MRLRLSLIAVAIICAKLPGATVTYTLSLNENASGQCAPGNFTLYGSVSKDDNFGLYAWAVDLKAAPDGGPTYTNFINRSPGGYFNVDPNDPDYDPNFEYPQVSAGFVIVRSVQPDRGIFGGQLNSHPGDANVMIGGFG